MKAGRFFSRFFWVMSAVLLCTCDTQNSIDPVFKDYFIKYYGEDGNHEAKDFAVNDDGTIIMVGTVTFGQGSVSTRRVYVVKTDLEGNELWNKTLGSDYNEVAADIEPIVGGPDAGHFLVLSNFDLTPDQRRIRLTVINTNGDSLKSFVYSIYSSLEGVSVTSMSNGTAIIAGVTTDIGANTGLPIPPTVLEDFIIFRVLNDYSIDITLNDRIGGAYEGSAIKVVSVGSDFIYAAFSDELTTIGNIPDNGVYEHNFIFRRFEGNPGSVSALLFSGSLSLDEKMSALSSRPLFGTFCAIGTQSDLNGANRRAYAAVVSSALTSIQAEGVVSPSSSHEYEGVAITAASTSYMMLANEINAAGRRDIYFKKMSTSLVPEFDLRFGAVDNDDRGAAVAELPNGDILILGTMQLAGQQDKIALIKLRPNGTF
ncbi:MAG: hypothetical protein KF687_11840 [Cyclobacteriaceae bacterium]|nr:hypothetical protein [Cyclobacteriaceae bacterium]